MKLRTLCFEGDYALEKRAKEESNYCYVNLYAATFGIAQFILTELQPIDIDGCGKLTVCANVEPQNKSYETGYHTVPEMGVSWYNLDIETSRKLYALKDSGGKADDKFVALVADIVMDALVSADRLNRERNHIAERRNGILERLRECGCRKEILLEKYSKLRRGRKYRAMVYRCIGHGIGDAIRIDLVRCATSEVAVSKWLEELPHTVDMAGAVTKTAWAGDAFNVTFYRSPNRVETVELPDNESC